MTKQSYIKELAFMAGVTHETAGKMLTGLAELVKANLAKAGEAIIPDLGKLVIKVNKARPGRNLMTGEVVQIPERRVVKFRAGKELKETVA